MRRDYLTYLLVLAVLSLLQATVRAGEAQLSADAGIGPAAAALSPAVLIEDTVQQLLTRLNEPSVSGAERSEALHALVTEVVVPHLDMGRIARIVLGKHARQVDDAALEEFTGEFRTLLVRTYANSLVAYHGEQIEVTQATPPDPKGVATVDLRIHRAEGAPVEISFLAHNRSGPWLVYDIRIEGISLVANYRSEFATILRRDGVDGLIRNLKQRNRQAQLAVR